MTTQELLPYEKRIKQLEDRIEQLEKQMNTIDKMGATMSLNSLEQLLGYITENNVRIKN